MSTIKLPKIELAVTFGAVGLSIMGLLIVYFTTRDLLLLALLAGSVGGIGHEFAQSGGTIAFYKVREDGVYFGSLSGWVLGAISGLLFFSADSNQTPQIILVQSLLAGLALKGISEAIGGQVIPKVSESISIENVKLDVNTNQATVTVRNIGAVGVNITRIYVDSQPFDQQNISITPEIYRDISINNINPSLTAGKSYVIKVITTKGTIQSGNYSV